MLEGGQFFVHKHKVAMWKHPLWWILGVSKQPQCELMFSSSMSHLTSFPSFYPHMVWIKFSQTFFSTCMTSKQCRTKRSYHRQIVRQLWMLLEFYWKLTLNIAIHMILKLDFNKIKHNWRDDYEYQPTFIYKWWKLHGNYNET